MDLSNTFFIQYFFLILISIVMIVNSILRFRQHPRISTYTIVVISACLVLAVAKTLENYGKETVNIPLTTFCSFLGYCLNAFCLFFFIMMSGVVKDKKMIIILLVPLIINVLVYTFMFVPHLKEAVVYFEASEGDLSFHGGALRFSSHIISALYLMFLVYISFSKISTKHIWHGLTLIVCSLFVVTAVIVESFFNGEDNIHVLSTTIAFSTTVYYLFLYIERTQFDALTGLFNRETFYRDRERMEKSVNAIIQFDMNGLKYINDTYGHLEGDKAIAEIAQVISKISKRNMYAYRLGGDEFTLVAINAKEEQILEFVNTFKKKIIETNYYCSIGYAIRSDKRQTIEDLSKIADEKMYQDKAKFYENASFERRKN